DAKFRNAVVGAYDGRCAMCGLALGLVQGAHIYPASAPNSVDQVQNGLALCPNHHAAFDRHLIWIEPGSLRLVPHPTLFDAASVDSAAADFIASMAPAVRPPSDHAAHPSDAMLRA